MKKRVLTAVAVCVAAILLCGGITVGRVYATTVKGDKETLVSTFRSMRTAPSEMPADYWDIWTNSIYKSGFSEEADHPRYGLYIAVGDSVRDQAEMGIVRRSSFGDLFGRAKVLEYVVSENAIGSYLVTDESGNGQSMIFFSSNAMRISCGEAVYLVENGERQTETLSINPNFPIHCILYGLGTTEKNTKQLQSVSFYDEDGVLVYTYSAV